jgi:hypothetical protein
MSAPVNAFLEEPTYPEQELRQAREEWKQQAEEWRQLNESVGGNPAFFPLTVKAFYVFGVIYQICRCVTSLLASREPESITSIPAYGVLASGIEVLGRCIIGNPSARSEGDLKAGFWWLATDSYQNNVDGNHVLIETTRRYSIAELVALRHFAAHGQVMMKRPVQFDRGILAQMGNPDHHLIATGLERYWARVLDSEEICNRLARANIMIFPDSPLFTILKLFSATPYRSVTEIFSEFDWRS